MRYKPPMLLYGEGQRLCAPHAGLFEVGGLKASGFTGPPSSNVTGGGNLTLPAGGAATLDVLIIPRQAAAPSSPQQYSVGGVLSCARQSQCNGGTVIVQMHCACASRHHQSHGPEARRTSTKP